MNPSSNLFSLKVWKVLMHGLVNIFSSRLGIIGLLDNDPLARGTPG